MTDLKQCTACAKEGIGPKPVSAFRPSARYRDGLMSWCREHSNRYVAGWKKSDPQRARNGEIRAAFKKRYNISTDDYTRIFESQQGLCAICGVPMMSVLDVKAGEGKRLKARVAHVDHCHESGSVRGLLCSCCNTGLGQLQESPRILMSAIAYIRATSKEQADA